MRRGGQAFRCPTNKCRAKSSARDRTFLSMVKLPLENVHLYFYLFITGTPQSAIITQLQISTRTAAALNKYTRQLLADAVDVTDVKISGPGIGVEIDESKFKKRKYHRGHRLDGAWVLRGVKRTAVCKLFVKVVEIRVAKTLKEIVQQHVLPDSIIYTDCWRGYANLEAL